MAVIAPANLRDAVPARRAPGEPDRAHRRLGARRDEPDHLDRRNRVDDLLRQEHLALGGRAEARPTPGGLANGVDRLGIGVPEDQGSPRTDPVEEPPAVLGFEVRPPLAGRRTARRGPPPASSEPES